MAERIQRRRTRGWEMPEGVVVIGRGTPWGNPYKVVKATCLGGSEKVEWWVEDASRTWRFPTKPEAQAAAVKLFAETATERFKAKVKLALRGKTLACWCKPGDPCHADVLLEWANA